MHVSKLAPLALMIFIGACSSEPASQPASEPAAAPAPPPAASGPRVFFVQPQDGATVKSPVHLQFGVENYTIAPVPPGEVATVREGMGHHHVGIDTDCLAPATEIVKGTPSWVHFGDGKSEIDMQLTPGPHKLTLQIGDDKHTTISGLCQTITVNVT